MNCPSRNDDVLLHQDWNQNPPTFAADLTTCEDLNGIANVRELGDAHRLRSGLQSLGPCDLNGSDVEKEGNKRRAMGEGVKGPLTGPCTRKMSKKIAEDRAGTGMTDGGLSAASWRDWALWLMSVFFTSTLISSLGRHGWPLMATSKSATPKASVETHRFTKRNGCASGSAQPEYDMPFHVGGLFIILFVSSTACAFPILVIKFPRLRIPASFLFCAKHFGTGVLIATAFVHLLPTAFLSLSNPCLSSFWTQDYPAMPGAIMLASILFVTVIEMVFSPSQHICGGDSGVAAVSREDGESQPTAENEPRNQVIRTYSDGSMRVREMGPLRGRLNSISRTLSKYRKESERLDAIESAASRELDEQPKWKSNESAIEDPEVGPQHHQGHQLTPEQAHRKAVMQCFLLEMGILFHSVFIGMSLAVAVGNDFVVLLIAIIFHQTFEGLALGVRIANIDWPKRSLQPWLMAIAYGCTTPLGQAIGIATHTLYSPESEIGLLVVGTMNAISAGFLVFASLVELMSEDFLSDESWIVLRGKRRVFACLLVFFGAFLMSLVGAWA
ncbi:Zip-domain-containing protein [Lentithecium fluviatile CBS 122367]|uniref:Zip-domain-containing protein n=1 Tax=Lentithecium fluviatile CBS 122367 TaxID=1168545 RepID=A0A6G1INF3_9PLEO|nr:Zip-domain-containing protein [Lentithecium fluviatile CBS 122367]